MAIIDRDELYFLEDGTYEWQDKPFSGIAREYRPDKSVVSESEFVDGMQDGFTRGYYPSGKLYTETHWVKNSHHGPARVWYENGQMERDALYEHGILVKEKKWDDSGQLLKDFQITEDHPLFKILESRRLRNKLPS